VDISDSISNVQQLQRRFDRQFDEKKARYVTKIQIGPLSWRGGIFRQSERKNAKNRFHEKIQSVDGRIVQYVIEDTPYRPYHG
jgi:hypothetical protein